MSPLCEWFLSLYLKPHKAFMVTTLKSVIWHWKMWDFKNNIRGRFQIHSFIDELAKSYTSPEIRSSNHVGDLSNFALIYLPFPSCITLGLCSSQTGLPMQLLPPDPMLSFHIVFSLRCMFFLPLSIRTLPLIHHIWNIDVSLLFPLKNSRSETQWVTKVPGWPGEWGSNGWASSEISVGPAHRVKGTEKMTLPPLFFPLPT